MRQVLSILTASLIAAAFAAPGAQAEFGLKTFDVTFTDENGATVSQAGAHPFAMTTSFEVNTTEDEVLGEIPDEPLKDLILTQIVGLAGNPYATPRCDALDFLDRACPDSTAVGISRLTIGTAGTEPLPTAVYNLNPPPGVTAKLAFWAASVPVTIEVGVSEDPPYRIVARIRNAAQIVAFFGAETTLWGNPGDPRHDEERGACAEGEGSCPANIGQEAFLILPRTCTGPLASSYEANSWVDPGDWVSGSVLTHDDAVPPNPLGFTDCGKLGLSPRLEAQSTTASAESPTGMDLNIAVEDERLLNPEGIAGSDIQKVSIALPEGVTANPSLAEGLGVCSEAEFARERLNTPFGSGCPNSSKIGTIEVESQLLEGKVLNGSLFVATPNDPATPEPENPFDSLIALYMVFRSTELGIVIRQAANVTPDPQTGRLVATVEDLPELPFSSARVHLREGARSPLITPPVCGTHTTEALFTPRANPATTVPVSASFQITSGVGGGPCPSGGQPFQPGFEAGSINNEAGSYSPFYMRLTRRDGDQALTRFDATLPPGLVAKLAGVGRCSNAQIALAKTKSGKAEFANPSCPANSKIGRLLAGAGVGSQLVYVPGSVYLAGPFGGAPLSVVGVVPAVAGPFDVGTVVVRQALMVDPLTAKVTVDGARSEPIPQILAGIPLRVRDIQVFVDRPKFTLNPTSCAPDRVLARIFGQDPVTRQVRFQAANCASLGFKPRLGLRLRGGTRRGANPALRAVFRPRSGDANLKRTVVRLPRSAFLDQSHIRTICTRVQFAADSCPAGAIYGHVTAFSPLLDQPLKGPAYLRSSDNKLPDLVFDLKGVIDVEAVARIDSIRGAIRATFPAIPDAPLSKVVVAMQGGKKGLIVNSRNLCAGKNRAKVGLAAHNGRRLKLRPLVRASGCKGKRKSKRSPRSGR